MCNQPSINKASFTGRLRFYSEQSFFLPLSIRLTFFLSFIIFLIVILHGGVKGAITWYCLHLGAMLVACAL